MSYSSSSVFSNIRRSAFTTLGLVVLTSFAYADVDSTRGQVLYDTHCGTCHDTSAHKRENHLVTSMDELRSWVAAMGAHTELDWRVDDVEDVAFYLNLRIYRFSR